MEKETKEAFDILLSNIEEKKNFLKENFSPSYKKSPIEISVYETADLAGLHLFSDYNEEFRLSKRQGYLIREYFQMTQIEDAINELYDFYPSIKARLLHLQFEDAINELYDFGNIFK